MDRWWRMGAEGIRIASLACVLAALSASALAGGRQQSGRGDTPAGLVAGEGAEGAFRVYRDPQTGDFGVPPTVASPEAAGSAGPAGGAGGAVLPALRERRSPLPGGGVIVDLGGRFQATVRAERDGAGRIVASCATAESSGSPDGGLDR